MGYIAFGDQSPKFGLLTETTGFIQSFNCKTSQDEAFVENETGSVLTYFLFNRKFEGAFVLVDKTGATLPSVATAVALANVSEVSKVIIFEKDRTRENKGVQKHNYTYKAWDSIDVNSSSSY